MNSAAKVLMIFHWAGNYIEWIEEIRRMGGYTFLERRGQFHHIITIKDVELEMITNLKDPYRLERFMEARRVDWIICKDFNPDEREITLFSRRLTKDGALSSFDLFIVGDKTIQEKHRWLQ